MRFEDLFDGGPAARGSAPGRVNLIGEHTDYNGGLVLPAAISLRVSVELRYRGDGQVRGSSREFGAAEAALAAPPDGSWLDYVRGVARELAAGGRIPERGFDVLVASELPEGSGLSSSAALAVASAFALVGAAGAPPRPTERASIAELCQRAERDFVGVPCGLMDPYASACGSAGCALLLDCARVRARRVRLPAELEILVFDTGVRRDLRSGAFERRVRECERARDEAARLLSRPLAWLSELRGADLTALEPRLDPTLLRRVRHVTGENERVERFAAALESHAMIEAGEALYASHESLRVDYEVSWPEADWLVSRSRELRGMVGARMTGAGFGGCTLHLAQAEHAAALAARLQADFEEAFGRPGRIHRLVASDGASLVLGPALSA